MPPVSTRSLVLQSFPYSDTSKILRLITLEYGLRSVIAKGAQRPKSRFGGLLEPFTEGVAAFYLKEDRDLHTLSGFDLLRSRQRIGHDLSAFTGASLLCEIVLRFGTEEPQPALFRALSEALESLLESPERSGGIALTAVWRIIALLGFEPETEQCLSCGRSLAPEEAAGFHAEAGGVTCRSCRPHGRVFDAASRSELRAMLSGTGGAVASASLHGALLRTYLSAQLESNRPLRSLELFLEHLPAS